MGDAAARMVRQWTAAVKPLLAPLHGHLVNALSCFSVAVCLAGHCHSGRVAAFAPSGARPASCRRRWERLLANPRLDAADATRTLARSVLAGWSGRELLLVLDETPNGEPLRCLGLGVAYRKRLLSIAAECYPTDRPPLPMPKLIGRMLRQAAKLLPPDARVTLLTDRGLSWPAVMDRARKLGWGHVMRLQRATRVELPDGRVVPAGDLARARGDRGDRWHGTARVFKKAGWRDARVTATWGGRATEPWLLAARADTGPGGRRAAAAYAKRNWCEQTFRDEKSAGFRWQDSRVAEPARAARLVLVMTLANLLAVGLGTWLVKSGRRHDLDPHRRGRRLSVFQLGLRWLRHALVSPDDDDDDDATTPPYLPYLHPS